MSRIAASPFLVNLIRVPHPPLFPDCDFLPSRVHIDRLIAVNRPPPHPCFRKTVYNCPVAVAPVAFSPRSHFDRVQSPVSAQSSCDGKKARGIQSRRRLPDDRAPLDLQGICNWKGLDFHHGISQGKPVSVRLSIWRKFRGESAPGLWFDQTSAGSRLREENVSKVVLKDSESLGVHIERASVFGLLHVLDEPVQIPHLFLLRPGGRSSRHGRSTSVTRLEAVRGIFGDHDQTRIIRCSFLVRPRRVFFMVSSFK